MEKKYCGRCGENLDVAMFGTNPARPDGLQTYCKPCARSYRLARKNGHVGLSAFAVKHDADKRALAEAGIRRCPKCEQTKPLSEFGKNASRGDGLQVYCNPCYRQSIRDHYRKDIDKSRSYARIRAAKHFAANRDSVLAASRMAKRKKYATPEGRAAKQAANREWGRKNKDKKRDAARKWREKNPMARKAIANNYLSRKKGAVGFATGEQIKARIEYYGHKCYLCGGPFEHLDHVKPLKRGGSNWPANLRPSCKSCNTAKCDKPLTEFVRRA